MWTQITFVATAIFFEVQPTQTLTNNLDIDSQQRFTDKQ